MPKKPSDLKATFDEVGSSMGAGQPVRGDVAHWLPTGLPLLDACTSAPGIPSGRLTLLAGRKGAGKSSLCLHLAAQMCEMGGWVLWADSEHSWVSDRAEDCGVDMARVSLVYPPTLEETVDWLYECLQQYDGKEPLLVVWDSTSALRTASLQAGKKKPGDHAVQISGAMRRLMADIWRKQATFVAVAQLKQRIAIGFSGGGETFLGERPLKHNASIVLTMKMIERLKAGTKALGQRAKLSVEWNRFGPPWRQFCLDVMFRPNELTRCIEDTWPAFELAVEKKLVTGGAGGVYKFGERKFKRSEWPELKSEAIAQVFAEEEPREVVDDR